MSDIYFSTNTLLINENTSDNEAGRIYCNAVIDILATSTTISLNVNRILFGVCGEILGSIDGADDSGKSSLRRLARAIYEFVNTNGMYVRNDITQ
jgi:hypothetical protein